MLWTPSSCVNVERGQGCIIDYAGENDGNNYLASLSSCGVSTHVSAFGNIAHHTVIHEENARIGRILRIAQAIRGALLEDDLSWTFNVQRQLLATFRGITATQRTNIQAAADTEIGPGLIQVIRG